VSLMVEQNERHGDHLKTHFMWITIEGLKQPVKCNVDIREERGERKEERGERKEERGEKREGRGERRE